MQRLGDIVAQDLASIMDDFRDFTRLTTLQCGVERVEVMASLQSDSMQFNADVSPINAFSLYLYYKESDNAVFNRSLMKNSIIYVDSIPFRIVDAVLTMGLRTLSLERKSGR